MFDNIKNLIKTKDYELKDILEKINIVWVKNMITKEQMEELEALARQNAVAENSYAPLQKQIDNANARIDKLEARIEDLENKETGEVTEPEKPVETDEYPEYKQPTGAHDAYHVGDKITYKGKKYICKMDGCVWAPDVYPAGWEEVVEDTESTEDTNEEG